ncbi:DUF3850 domain-containing protein [Clostridium minihomine]|uniref:DUF3850 domain-containing protein n=1 Tax=Clostridium minihomine TaxID=2045012 RepID=UPI000C76D4B4|nr:DUF3850 domain-containing protein [Clostridium minihomine]
MARVHELKIRPEYFGSVDMGLKPFEVRKDDRGFSAGDFLILKEWSNGYTGHEVRVAITYILRESCYVRPGYIIMGIRKVG